MWGWRFNHQSVHARRTLYFLCFLSSPITIFIHLYIIEHLTYFQSLVIVNGAVVNMGVCVPFPFHINVFVFFGRNQDVESLVHMDISA